jgi:SAM-dependent methyltransferase
MTHRRVARVEVALTRHQPAEYGAMDDARRYAPATQRNRDAILAVLKRHLPARGLVLELASGSGEHVVHFAAALPDLVFQPSDPDAASRASIDAWAASTGLGNLRPAIALDATAPDWPVNAADAVLCINMIHIAPWAAAVGLVEGAFRILAPGGVLYLYGPFKREGRHTARSNDAFDRFLRERNVAWGVRDVESVAALAAGIGFAAPEIEAMPANNLSLIFRRDNDWKGPP